MTSRLRVWQPLKSTDGFGSKSVEWVPYRDGATIAAERRKTTGGLSTAGRETFADYKADYYIYWQHKIERGWKVEDTETGLQYMVELTFPDRINNLTLIQCSRIND